MFAYRHHVLLGDMQLANFLESESDRIPKRIAITGTNGLIGQRIVSLLSVLGHDVIPNRTQVLIGLLRWKTRALWDPKAGLREPSLLDGVDAVIHLAGENIAGRWTNRKKEELLQSREHATEYWSINYPSSAIHPKRLLPRRGLVSTEIVEIASSRKKKVSGVDSSEKLAQRWKTASASLESKGIRRVYWTSWIVLHPRLGALSMMLPLFRYGLGGRLGKWQAVLELV